ncbi:MAG: hypothetical protein QOI56_1563, partial [Actinomycetota bacterium]|nr:hypothetical protein [Actinomycetota bacterium]
MAISATSIIEPELDPVRANMAASDAGWLAARRAASTPGAEVPAVDGEALRAAVGVSAAVEPMGPVSGTTTTGEGTTGTGATGTGRITSGWFTGGGVTTGGVTTGGVT